MMKYAQSSAVIVEPGKYFLGDPYYSVPDELWSDLLDSCDYFQSPIGEIQGFKVLGFATRWGDGSYKDQYGTSYDVDAGLIGLVPAGLITDDMEAEQERCPELGQWVTFNEPTRCYENDGVLHFGVFEIDTDPKYYDEEDDLQLG